MNNAAAILAMLVVASASCTAAAPDGRAGRRSDVVRITGSDTMVNLLQAWAEHYRDVRPDVSVQVAGGGSGVGFAGLVEGTIDIAAASREMKPQEQDSLRQRTGREARQVVVALDGLAVYVTRDSPLETITIGQLAEVFGEGGMIDRWSVLGVRQPGCRSDDIIRVGRQNNSGTFAYFRDVVLGRTREYKMGSIDQSGSKDVVALVSSTPCAIGYSGMAFATRRVKVLRISRHAGDVSVEPTDATIRDRSYPFARPLYLYTAGPSTDAVRAFVDWAQGSQGQAIVHAIGFVGALGVAPGRVGAAR